MGFQKLKRQVISYRSNKNFDNNEFQLDVKTCRFDKNGINSLVSRKQSFELSISMFRLKGNIFDVHIYVCIYICIYTYIYIIHIYIYIVYI